MSLFKGWFPRPPRRDIDPAIMVNDINKILVTLESCYSVAQVDVARAMVDKFRIRWQHLEVKKCKNNVLLHSLHAKVSEKRAELYSQLD